jgi:hypothetical protein
MPMRRPRTWKLASTAPRLHSATPRPNRPDPDFVDGLKRSWPRRSPASHGWSGPSPRRARLAERDEHIAALRRVRALADVDQPPPLSLTRQTRTGGA